MLLINLAAFLFVVLLTGVLIPQILLIAFRKQLFDIPDERKIHTLPVPRLGGLAFLPAIFFTVLLICGIGMATGSDWLCEIISGQAVTQGIFLGCSMMALYIVGVADDLIGIRYSAKFIVQILAGILLVAGGIILDDLHGLFGIHELPVAVAIPLTILVIVFITNAINLIDGIDGLASGLSLIAAAIYGVLMLANGLSLFSLVAFCTCGALLSFFCFNVFGNAERHKKIFMGDTGALTVGIILSALSIRICGMHEMGHGYNPAVVAFAPLLIPCLDVVRVYLHRIRNRVSPFLPDKNHIHHKLLALGLRRSVVMPTIVLSSLLFTLANCWLSSRLSITLLFLLDLVVWTFANLLLSRRLHPSK